MWEKYCDPGKGDYNIRSPMSSPIPHRCEQLLSEQERELDQLRRENLFLRKENGRLRGMLREKKIPIGPKCSESGIFAQTLEGEFEHPKGIILTKEIVFEIEKFRRKTGATWIEVKCRTVGLFVEKCSTNALINSFHRVYNKAVSLRKAHKARQLEEHLKCPYVPPSSYYDGCCRGTFAK